MGNSFLKVLLIVVLVPCCFPSLVQINADEPNLEGVTEPGKARDWQESENSNDISLQQLQENYNNGTLELMEFIKSLTTTLSKRLDILEKKEPFASYYCQTSGRKHQFWRRSIPKAANIFSEWASTNT
ncbi:unnamed protein product [Allacma fusca]|uniref:Uncharacterized protein n=1 Tax=Allacma fusca TaxID=39272 RepID=A0A8J2PG18_9HEXA|nr:unnamed protein product [Allacma fusca]